MKMLNNRAVYFDFRWQRGPCFKNCWPAPALHKQLRLKVSACVLVLVGIALDPIASNRSIGWRPVQSTGGRSPP